MHAQVIPPNLPAGTQYRVVFIATNGYQAYNATTPSTTRSLSYRQNIVNAEAVASMSPKITGAKFRLVGSIFDGSTTVSGPAVAGMNGDRNANTLNAKAWTGWTPTLNNRPFGSPLATFSGNSAQTRWAPAATLGSTCFLRVYAISAPIMTLPTPGAAAITGLGGLVAARRRRARCC